MPDVRPASAVTASPPQPNPESTRARSRRGAGAAGVWVVACANAAATEEGAVLTEGLLSSDGGRSGAMDPYAPWLSAAGAKGGAQADAGRLPGTSTASVQNCQAGGAEGQEGSGSHPCEGTHPAGGGGQPGGSWNTTDIVNQQSFEWSRGRPPPTARYLRWSRQGRTSDKMPDGSRTRSATPRPLPRPNYGAVRRRIREVRWAGWQCPPSRHSGGGGRAVAMSIRVQVARGGGAGWLGQAARAPRSGRGSTALRHGAEERS